MSSVKSKSASEQCLEHVEKRRFQAKMDEARESLSDHMERMAIRYGAAITVGVLVRYIGVLLLEGAHRPQVVECRGYLLRKIIRSILRSLLTQPPMLH
jgi:hypothetical protein